MKAARAIEIGTVLNRRYRLERFIGKGGMGAVYEAEDINIGRRFAVKHLHADFLADTSEEKRAAREAALKRFHREARFGASIRNDNICSVLDFGQAEDGSPFLVMELLEGATLAEILKRHKRLPPSRITDILSQTLSALQAAHEAHIVHRDLKPDNIFVTTVGDRTDFVKLLDFGISKIIDQATKSRLTQPGTALGTPHYMAPEQARGERNIDHRTDIWAVGIILYEALTGKKPFDGENLVSVLYQICSEEFEAPRSIDLSISDSFQRVILKALQKDVRNRYGSATEMREALFAALGESHAGRAEWVVSPEALSPTLPSLVPFPMENSNPPPARAEKPQSSIPAQQTLPIKPAASRATVPKAPASAIVTPKPRQLSTAWRLIVAALLLTSVGLAIAGIFATHRADSVSQTPVPSPTTSPQEAAAPPPLPLTALPPVPVPTAAPASTVPVETTALTTIEASKVQEENSTSTPAVQLPVKKKAVQKPTHQAASAANPAPTPAAPPASSLRKSEQKSTLASPQKNAEADTENKTLKGRYKSEIDLNYEE